MAIGASLIEIIMNLRGGREVAAGSRAAAAGIGEVSAAATAANAKTAEAAAATAAFGNKMKTAGSKMKSIGRSMITAAAPVALIGGYAVKSAMDFDASMELMHTQAGDTQHAVQGLSKQILGLAASGKVTQGPIDLSHALFRLEGAGLRGKEAMDALRQSSHLATVGMADVEDTAKTLAQTYFVGVKGTGTFKDTVAELNATVGQGDLRLQQLVDALGVGILPAAKQANLTFQDITGAIAVFGDETNNVSGFTAQLATALHFLTNPGDKAAKAMGQIGLSQKKLVEDMMHPRGLLTALSDLRERLATLPGGPRGVQAQQVLGDILPGGRGRILLTLMNQLERYKQKMDQIRKTHDKFGDAVRRSMDQPLNKLKAAWVQLQATLIELGNVLIPAVVPVLKDLAGIIGSLASGFTKLPKPVQSVMIGFFAFLLIGGPILIFIGSLVEAIGTLVAAWAALDIAITPVLIVAAVVAIGVAFFVAYKKIRWFHNAVDNVVAFLKKWGPLILVPLTAGMSLAVANIIANWGSIKKAFTDAAQFIAGIATKIAGFVSRMADKIISPFKGMGPILAAPFAYLFQKIQPIFSWIVDKVNWLVDKIMFILDHADILHPFSKTEVIGAVDNTLPGTIRNRHVGGTKAPPRPQPGITTPRAVATGPSERQLAAIGAGAASSIVLENHVEASVDGDVLFKFLERKNATVRARRTGRG